MIDWKKSLKRFDDRRFIVIPGNQKETIDFSVDQFIQIGQESIKKHSFFFVAVSGGSTPNAIFKQLSQPPYNKQLDWSHVFLFWSDERSVPPDHPESNYHMAMEAGLKKLPIPQEQVIRMKAEENIEQNAKLYEEKIRKHVPHSKFDLIMLGMGDDGHTASLFPHTYGLNVEESLVVANFVPQKETWRMSLTYKCIHSSRYTCIYVLGKNKAEMVTEALLGPYDPNLFPVQRVGTADHPAIWILDKEAAIDLFRKRSK